MVTFLKHSNIFGCFRALKQCNSPEVQCTRFIKTGCASNLELVNIPLVNRVWWEILFVSRIVHTEDVAHGLTSVCLGRSRDGEEILSQ